MRKTAILLSVFFIACVALNIAYADEADVREEIERIQEKIKQQGLLWEAGYNEIMDLPLEQRRARLGHVVPDYVQEIYDNLDIEPPLLTETQSSFDWRLMGGVTPVTDQGDCGSCWAFAATAGFESSYKIATGIELDISEQAVVSCDYFSNGCEGGWCGSAYNLFSEFGAVAESCMPYQQSDAIPCTQEECEVLVMLEGYQPIPNDIGAIKSFLARGPVSTSFTVYDDFYSYQRGCYYHANTEPTNHAVILVGWDDNECNGHGAWIAKNSWGPGFGRLGGYFYIQYDAAAIGSNTIAPYYQTQGMGDISYSPDSYNITLPEGTEDTYNLQLQNIGDGELRYYITPYAITDQDEFGYYYRDSDHPDGPEYNWIDISQIGSEIDFNGYDDNGNSGSLDLGFDFTLYDITGDEISICVNGWASFSTLYIMEWRNDPIPSLSQPNKLLAAFFDDLNLEHGGEIYYYTNNTDSAIVTWNNVPDSSQTGTYTFQIILVAPDKVVFQYDSMGPGRLDECTIGIENRYGTIGTQVAYNEPYIHDEMAIEFILGDPPPEMNWIIPSLQSDIIPPYDSRDIDITFDATTLPEGNYEALISIMNTSMFTPIVEIPVNVYVEQGIGIADNTEALPAKFMINSTYPNPFNASSSIAYSLPEPAEISLEIYNLLGQKVRTLYNGHQTEGYHTYNWDASDLSTGVYLVKLTNGTQVETSRITLLK